MFLNSDSAHICHLHTQLEDLTDSYKRTLAEMENVRKRAEKQQALTKDFAIQVKY